MIKRDISYYLKDILENASRAQKFLENLDLNKFFKDEKTQFAVIRCLEIIGEATKHIPKHIREKYPNIPWKAVAGMRDIMIHFSYPTIRKAR